MESAVESLASSSKRHKTSKKITGQQYDYEGHRKVNSSATRPRHRDFHDSTSRVNTHSHPGNMNRHVMHSVICSIDIDAALCNRLS